MKSLCSTAAPDCCTGQSKGDIARVWLQSYSLAYFFLGPPLPTWQTIDNNQTYLIISQNLGRSCPRRNGHFLPCSPGGSRFLPSETCRNRRGRGGRGTILPPSLPNFVMNRSKTFFTQKALDLYIKRIQSQRLERLQETPEARYSHCLYRFLDGIKTSRF